MVAVNTDILSHAETTLFVLAELYQLILLQHIRIVVLNSRYFIQQLTGCGSGLVRQDSGLREENFLGHHVIFDLPQIGFVIIQALRCDDVWCKRVVIQKLLCHDKIFVCYLLAKKGLRLRLSEVSLFLCVGNVMKLLVKRSSGEIRVDLGIIFPSEHAVFNA